LHSACSQQSSGRPASRGARFLRVLADQWDGGLALTTASYNPDAGVAMARYRGVPPYHKRRRYFRRVLVHYKRYGARNADRGPAALAERGNRRDRRLHRRVL
jgi:soluble lytic murein transglycosylase-like protein